MHTRGRWILLPENRACVRAVDRVLECVCSRTARRAINPLFLSGPPGSGKTYLTTDLVHELTRRSPDVVVSALCAADLVGSAEGPDLREADLFLIEDVQQLPARGAVALAGLVDHCLSRQRQLVLTATLGPAQLTHLPARLTSRLGQGLTTVLEALGPDSRREFLHQRGLQREITLQPAVLDWLAAHTPGSPRQLDGALTRLAALTANLGRPAEPADLEAAFREDAAAHSLSIDRIVQRVGRYFQVKPAELCSSRRSREVLVPRQVGMYLARRLTGLSLGQIGAFFGGRDHSTVLHACRKVEQALSSDVRLCGAVRQLHADLL